MKEDWVEVRMKDIAILNPNPSNINVQGYVSFVPMECLRTGYIEKRKIDYKTGKSKYTFFAENDLLLAKVTPCFENGNIAIAENLEQKIGFGSSEIFVYRFKEGIYTRYMFYLLQSKKFRDSAIATMSGVGGLKRISPLFMSIYSFSCPIISEQVVIANYLDTKTTQIAAKISLLERKRDTYLRLKKSLIKKVLTKGLNPNIELKSSGISWPEKVPGNWEIKRIKDVSIIRNGTDYKAIQADEGYPVIGSGGTFAYATDYIYDGEAVLLGRKGTIDKPLYVNGKFWVVDTMFYLITSKKIDTKYLYYSALLIPYGAYSTSTALPSMTQRDLNNHLLLLPPLSEQKEIVNYLDERTQQIDNIVSTINEQIRKLQTLRKSLINEVVTGERSIV